MERQVGLGRSLEDVLDSLAPAEADATGSARGLFDPEDLEQQLDTLMGDMRDLRERVQHLVSLVPDDAVDGTRPQRLGLVAAPDAGVKRPAGERDDNEKKKKNKNKARKKKGKKKAGKHKAGKHKHERD
jgi:hypothetical protein